MVTMKIGAEQTAGIDPNSSSGFEPYEGPLPPAGVYAAVIRSVRIRVSQAGNPYFNVLMEFGDQTTPEKQKFKGYPLWDKVVPGESDIQKERLAKFMNTVCGKTSGNVMHDEVTDGGKVTKIGGKDPVGVKCKVVAQRGSYSGEPILECRDLFPWPKDVDWPDGSGAEDEESTEEIEDETDEDAPEEAEGDEPEDDEEGDEEPEDEAEEEGDDEDEEDDGAFEARQAELAEMDRTAIKAELKKADPDFRVLKKHTDDDLRNEVLDTEFPPEEGDEPPF